jgi:hypothetical protein
MCFYQIWWCFIVQFKGVPTGIRASRGLSVPGPDVSEFDTFDAYIYSLAPTMSSEATAELAGQVQEWLRIDKVRINDVLAVQLIVKSRMLRIPTPNGRFRIYGLRDILTN